MSAQKNARNRLKRPKRCAPSPGRRIRKRVQLHLDVHAEKLSSETKQVDNEPSSETRVLKRPAHATAPSTRVGTRKAKPSVNREPETCLNVDRSQSLARLMYATPVPPIGIDLTVGNTPLDAPTALCLEKQLFPEPLEPETRLDLARMTELALQTRTNSRVSTKLMVFDGDLFEVDLNSTVAKSRIDEGAIQRAQEATDIPCAGAFAATHECWSAYSPRKEHFLERTPHREVLYPTSKLLVSEETLTLTVATCMRSYALEFYSDYCKNIEVAFTERHGALVCRYMSQENSKRLKTIMQMASERNAVACAYMDAAVDSLPHTISTTDITPCR